MWLQQNAFNHADTEQKSKGATKKKVHVGLIISDTADLTQYSLELVRKTKNTREVREETAEWFKLAERLLYLK